MSKKRYWRVEGTIQTDYGSIRLVNLQVVANTLEAVLPAVRERYPTFQFSTVAVDRWMEDVIVAGDATSA